MLRPACDGGLAQNSRWPHQACEALLSTTSSVLRGALRRAGSQGLWPNAPGVPVEGRPELQTAVVVCLFARVLVRPQPNEGE